MSVPARPLTVLIAALGGEGGGVLTQWIVSAASIVGFPVQSTSIPGVAQRTGGTTYYIEIVPALRHELAGKRPVLALTPGTSDIDLFVASEFLEAGRAVSAGYITADRTLVIASLSRFYVMNEKIAMGDGRYDQSRLIEAIRSNARGRILFDMEETARKAGAMINAVMLGAIAGSGRLPIPVDAFEAAIRADGKLVERNLNGFRAGFEAARAGLEAIAPAADGKRRRGGSVPDLDDEIRMHIPTVAREVVAEGVRRLVAYQGKNYAQLYLHRLEPAREADERSGSGGTLLRETARHLAMRMSYEDVIRVAQAKIDPARMRRIASELGITREPFSITEFLKPGIEELCQILPPRLARWLLRRAERTGRSARSHWGMEVRTTTVSGFLRFWLLAKLRRLRPYTYRYGEEQAAIEGWLALIVAAAKIAPELAVEVAECARLIKGYGDTHKRGVGNYRRIEARVIRPALDGRLSLRQGIDAIASARTAALTDPEGESLARCLDEIERAAPLAIAAE
jgi:indolepyruvate ferredoxin oxidoreductase beta subunit